MANEIINLMRCDSQLLMQAAIDIPLDELKELVNESIQQGPIISLRGALYRIEQQTTPPACWEALMVFVSWDAGIVAQDDGNTYAYLLADSANLDRALQSIRKHLDRIEDQGAKQATMRYLQRLVSQAQEPRKHNETNGPR